MDDDCKYSEFGQDLAAARQSYFIYVGNDAMIMPSLSNQGWSSQIDYSPDGSSTLTVKKVAQDLGWQKYYIHNMHLFKSLTRKLILVTIHVRI